MKKKTFPYSPLMQLRRWRREQAAEALQLATRRRQEQEGIWRALEAEMALFLRELKDSRARGRSPAMEEGFLRQYLGQREKLARVRAQLDSLKVAEQEAREQLSHYRTAERSIEILHDSFESERLWREQREADQRREEQHQGLRTFNPTEDTPR